VWIAFAVTALRPVARINANTPVEEPCTIGTTLSMLTCDGANASTMLIACANFRSSSGSSWMITSAVISTSLVPAVGLKGGNLATKSVCRASSTSTAATATIQSQTPASMLDEVEVSGRQIVIFRVVSSVSGEMAAPLLALNIFLLSPY
jgi:hypothetical protein